MAAMASKSRAKLRNCLANSGFRSAAANSRYLFASLWWWPASNRNGLMIRPALYARCLSGLPLLFAIDFRSKEGDVLPGARRLPRGSATDRRATAIVPCSSWRQRERHSRRTWPVVRDSILTFGIAPSRSQRRWLGKCPYGQRWRLCWVPDIAK